MRCSTTHQYRSHMYQFVAFQQRIPSHSSSPNATYEVTEVKRSRSTKISFKYFALTLYESIGFHILYGQEAALTTWTYHFLCHSVHFEDTEPYISLSFHHTFTKLQNYFRTYFDIMSNMDCNVASQTQHTVHSNMYCNQTMIIYHCSSFSPPLNLATSRASSTQLPIYSHHCLLDCYAQTLQQKEVQLMSFNLNVDVAYHYYWYKIPLSLKVVTAWSLPWTQPTIWNPRKRREECFTTKILFGMNVFDIRKTKTHRFFFTSTWFPNYLYNKFILSRIFKTIGSSVQIKGSASFLHLTR